jgi:hypothetical protein
MSANLSHRALAVTVVSLLCCATIAAQWTGSLSGPVLGYVFDRDAGMPRPVKGILGSATIGDPIDIGIAASQLLVLDTVHAVAPTDSGVQFLTLSLDAHQVSRTTIPGVAANPSKIVASRQGTSAAFYFTDPQQVQVVSGLPNAPRAAGLFQVDQPVTQMAVNDGGTLVVYVVVGPDGESLYAWSASAGGTRFLSTVSSVSGIAITSSDDAIVTDRGENEVFAIWNAGGAAIRRLLADVKDGISSPTGVAISSGGRIYVANTGSATAVVLDANGHPLKALSCDCTITGLFPLRDSVFRLTDRINQTTFLLDATSADERIVFVPPPPLE